MDSEALNELRKISRLLEALTDAVQKLANPPMIAGPVDLPADSLPGAIRWVPNLLKSGDSNA
jgi:hypothetical protein